VALNVSAPARDPVAGILMLTALGSLFAWAVMFSMFLPALILLSRWWAPTLSRITGLGLLIGLAVTAPMSWVMYRASGDDSGPPSGSYLDFLFGEGFDSVLLFFPLAGALTAGLYGGLSGWWQGRQHPGK